MKNAPATKAAEAQNSKQVGSVYSVANGGNQAKLPVTARKLIENGYRIVPVVGKAPTHKGWGDKTFTADHVLPHHTGVGIKLGGDDGLYLADLDVTDPEMAEVITNEWNQRFPDCMQRTGKAPKTAFLFRSDANQKKLAAKLAGKANALEILATGQQFVAFGTHPSTSKPYQWGDLDPTDPFLGHYDMVAKLAWDKVVAFTNDMAARFPRDDGPKPTLSAQVMDQVTPVIVRHDNDGPNADEVRTILRHLDPSMTHDDWLAVLLGLHELGDWTLPLAVEWSAASKKFIQGEVENRWKTFTRGSGGSWPSVCRMARDNGADLSRIAREHRPTTRAPRAVELADFDRTDDVGAEPVSAEDMFDQAITKARMLTGDDLAGIETVIEIAKDVNPLRQIAILNAIKEATGTPIGAMRAMLAADRKNEVLDHLDMARMAIRSVGRENLIYADGSAWLWGSTGVWGKLEDRAVRQIVQANIERATEEPITAGTISGVSDVLITEIFAPGHWFNQGDPEAVNATNGEITLTADGWTLLPHCREHYRTTQIPVEYDPNATAPMFEAFLNQVFRDDADRQDKIQSLLELMGYTLMSHARHEKFVMLIGPGANGKSVLLSVIEALVGQQNVSGVQPSNFDRTFQRAHLNMKLANIVTELRQGEIIADAELKAITSGEPSTVENKFEAPFTMRPYATCWFGTNHMPHTRDFSEALFRRATIIEFNRIFAPSEQDPRLKDRLLSELPGILRKALAAYAKALRDGFTEPQSSQRAKRAWRLEADQAAQFVDEFCTVGPNHSEPSALIYAHYQDWARESGVRQTLTKKGLSERLERLGFGLHRNKSARLITGLRVNPREALDTIWG